MKNITVTVDDELYRRARVRAAEEGTTVSAVVKGALREFTGQDVASEARHRALQNLFDRADSELQGSTHNAGTDPGSRDRLYDERFDETALGRALSARRR